MILLTLILACDTEPADEPAAAVEGAPTEAAPAEAAHPPGYKPRPPDLPPGIPAMPTRPPRPEVSITLPELDLAPELQPVAAQLLAGEGEAARTTLDAWLAEHPDDANAWYLHGESHMLSLSWPEAEASFSKALELDPAHADALQRKLGTLIGQRKCTEAVPLIAQYQALRPDDHEALVMRSFCKGAEGDHAGSLADVELACERGFEAACQIVPRLKGRVEWIERKKAELAEQEATGSGEDVPEDEAVPE